MNIDTAIKARRTIRKYKAKAVSKSLINKILEAGRWAPSAHNFQPWRFIVAQGQVKQKVADILKKPRRNEILLIRLILKSSVKIIESAPVIILLYKKRGFSKHIDSIGKVYSDAANLWDTQSVACAAQNMLLKAYSLGLGAAWVGIPVFFQKQINRFFNMNEKLMAVLTFGYPDEKPRPPIRKPLSEIANFRK